MAAEEEDEEEASADSVVDICVHLLSGCGICTGGGLEFEGD